MKDKVKMSLKIYQMLPLIYMLHHRDQIIHCISKYTSFQPLFIKLSDFQTRAYYYTSYKIFQCKYWLKDKGF